MCTVQPGSERFGVGIAAAIEQAHGLQQPPGLQQPMVQQITGRKDTGWWQPSEQAEVVSPPAAHLNGTTESVGLVDATVPLSSLTGVSRQAPWSGVALVSPPRTVRMPAASSPVTTLTWSWE